VASDEAQAEVAWENFQGATWGFNWGLDAVPPAERARSSEEEGNLARHDDQEDQLYAQYVHLLS
jgi:hypothetical protein